MLTKFYSKCLLYDIDKPPSIIINKFFFGFCFWYRLEQMYYSNNSHRDDYHEKPKKRMQGFPVF